jgi:hypothetical protein
MQKISLALVSAMLFTGITGWAQTRKVTDAEVMKVHKSAILMDTHNDQQNRHQVLNGERSTEGHTDIPRLREAAWEACSRFSWARIT